jgi:preprotein translocase subunit Sec63
VPGRGFLPYEILPIADLGGQEGIENRMKKIFVKFVNI